MGRIIFLYGAPASGKSTLARQLASALGVVRVDLDEEIVSVAGKSIPEIFAMVGEAGFRKLESETLRRVVSAAVSPMVVALGGGTLLNAENREFAEHEGSVWCLKTPSVKELERRIGAAPGSRPLGNRAEERAEHYASFMHRIVGWYELENSLVVVGSGIAPSILQGEQLVVDENVAKLYADKLGKPLAIIPSGEENKTIGTIGNLWSSFASAGLGRKNRVVAVGGGVTGDLTGFAAATWMRGIDWLNVPTSLLAMVDASTGGKTGCDLKEGKNLAGAFHSPRLVVIDTDFLATLPSKQMAEGRAEMIKHEIIGGLDHTTPLTSIPTAEEIYQNLGVKVKIVGEDPFERTGQRARLNCGHTVAHAVEKLSSYSIAHGAAVSIGCVVEAEIAVAKGLAMPNWPQEISARFAAAGLPVRLPEGLTQRTLKPAMLGDKKRDGNEVTFALPCGWGDVRNVKIDLSGDERC